MNVLPSHSGRRESFKNWLRLTLVDNPMFDESKREQRRFLRYGLAMRIVILALFAMFYLWLILESYLGHTDGSEPFCYLELVLLTLALPASIYGSISGERERATWDALVLTRLTASQIIFGKLIWRMRIIALIVVLSIIPIIVSRFNPDSYDTTNWMVFRTQLVLCSWSLLLCTFGLWVSSSTKRSITSLAVITGSLIGVLLALPVLYAMFTNMVSGSQTNADPISQVMYTLNPFVCMGPLLGTRPYGDSPLIAGGEFGYPQIAVFLGLALLFIVFTYWRIIRLERPIRGMR